MNNLGKLQQVRKFRNMLFNKQKLQRDTLCSSVRPTDRGQITRAYYYLGYTSWNV